jgi:hypothetical protein
MVVAYHGLYGLVKVCSIIERRNRCSVNNAKLSFREEGSADQMNIRNIIFVV